jgi:outer membrane immunogenic protein
MKFKYALMSFFLAVTPAAAADLTAPFESAPMLNWSGCYIGAQGGYAWGDSKSVDLIDENFVHATGELDPEGPFGGVHGGCSVQLESSIVLGVEADINLSGIDGEADVVTSDEGIRPDFFHSSELEWFGSLHGRLGYALDTLLLYVTGGLAFGDYSLDLLHGSDPSHNSELLTGWTIGGGLEYAFAENWSTRVEYRFTDYGTLHDTFDDFPREDVSADLTTHDVRVGVSFHF